MGKQYNSLKELKEAYDRGEMDKDAFEIVVDNDIVYAVVAYRDDDGEEIGEPKYLWSIKGDAQRLALHEALKLLGLPSDDA